MKRTGSFLLTIAVGVSRIELAVHYTSDVIGGFAVAGFWLAAAATLWAARDLEAPRRRRTCHHRHPDEVACRGW